LTGLRWEGAYSTPRPPSWIYREDREKEGRGRAGNGIKKGEREGEWQRECNAGRAGMKGEERNAVKRDGRREGNGQKGR